METNRTKNFVVHYEDANRLTSTCSIMKRQRLKARVRLARGGPGGDHEKYAHRYSLFPPDTKPAKGDATPKSLLMASGSSENVTIFREASRNCGFKFDFHSVPDGKHARDYIANRKRFNRSAPDLVLLDIDSSNSEWKKTMQAIRKDPEMRTVPIMILTSRRDRDLILGIYSLGGSAFIPKPLSCCSAAGALHRLGAYWMRQKTPVRNCW